MTESTQTGSTQTGSTQTGSTQTGSTQTGTNVRRLLRDDLAGVIALDALLTGEAKDAYWGRVFERFLRDEGCIGLAATDGEPADSKLLGYLFGELRAFEFGSKACGWIFAVGVVPDAARSGVGSALLAEARRLFRGLGALAVRTMVPRTDVPFLSFFRRHGFVGGPFVQLELTLGPDDDMEENDMNDSTTEKGTTASKRVRYETSHGGALLRLTLDAPKGNVLDGVMIGELYDAFERAAEDARINAVLLCGAGTNFCFGASVEEHLPENVEGMLNAFHGLLREIAATAIPVVVAVRGLCLGGGLELATFCHRIFAHPGASFGQPEIKLGVFAPVGSAILAERVGQGAADELLLSGHSVNATEALAMRLIDAVHDDPEAAAQAWVEEYLLPHSASSLRFATRAARLAFMHRFEATVHELEKLYRDELMYTPDAIEGITAFLEKRVPIWSDL